MGILSQNADEHIHIYICMYEYDNRDVHYGDYCTCRSRVGIGHVDDDIVLMLRITAITVIRTKMTALMRANVLMNSNVTLCSICHLRDCEIVTGPQCLICRHGVI